MRRSAVAALVDVVAVVLFVAIGRASHHHSQTVGGFLATLWPFAAGVGVGWVVSSRRSLWRLRAGITVCLFTYSSLSFEYFGDEVFADHFHRLRDFALEHAEASAIFGAID